MIVSGRLRLPPAAGRVFRGSVPSASSLIAFAVVAGFATTPYPGASKIVSFLR